MNKKLKRILWITLIIICILGTIRFAIADGSAQVKVKLHNGSFDLTDKNGNTNTFLCDRNQDYTFNYPAICDKMICNTTCKADIINLNATCNKECPTIPEQNISCNYDISCPETPEPDYSAFIVALTLCFLVIGFLVWLVFRFYNEKEELKEKVRTSKNYSSPQSNSRQTSPPEQSGGLEDL